MRAVLEDVDGGIVIEEAVGNSDGNTKKSTDGGKVEGP